jgi:isoleucyl-tRNA synthetase
MDAWITARLHETVAAVTDALAGFDSARATIVIEAFLDDLSNWYVRRARRRFWKSERDADKLAALGTLYQVLVTLTRLLAPFIPFTTEAMYQNLVRSVDPAAPGSVHHTEWPQADAALMDRRLLDKMGLAINVAALGRAARSSADVKLRQPLATAQVHVGSPQARADLAELLDVLSEEINVKQIDLVAEVGALVNYKLLPNNRVLGPRLGKLFPLVRSALASLDPAAVATTLQRGEAITVDLGGTPVSLSGEDILVQTESRGGLAIASDKGVTVAVDIHLTPELVAEGYARDLVRAINTLRKEAGFALDDRVHVTYVAEGESAAAFVLFADFIQRETLALSLAPGSASEASERQVVKIGDEQIAIALHKA